MKKQVYFNVNFLTSVV